MKISLSTDGGGTFGTVLAASTPNDGTADGDHAQRRAAADARLKVEAVDNYFFDVNDAFFALTRTATPSGPGVPDTTITAGPADDSVVLKKKQSFAYASTVAPATFVCRVDGDAVPCGTDGLREKFSRGPTRSAWRRSTPPASPTRPRPCAPSRCRVTTASSSRRAAGSA